MDITQGELREYLESIPYNNRDAVLEEIMKSEILKKAFEEPYGKAILTESIDLIADNVRNIVRLSIDKDDAARGVKIEEYARDIAIIDRFLKRWATIIASGDVHEKVAKVKKKRSI